MKVIELVRALQHMEDDREVVLLVDNHTVDITGIDVSEDDIIYIEGNY